MSPPQVVAAAHAIPPSTSSTGHSDFLAEEASKASLHKGRFRLGVGIGIEFPALDDKEASGAVTVAAGKDHYLNGQGKWELTWRGEARIGGDPFGFDLGGRVGLRQNVTDAEKEKDTALEGGVGLSLHSGFNYFNPVLAAGPYVRFHLNPLASLEFALRSDLDDSWKSPRAGFYLGLSLDRIFKSDRTPLPRRKQDLQAPPVKTPPSYLEMSYHHQDNRSRFVKLLAGLKGLGYALTPEKKISISLPITSHDGSDTLESLRALPLFKTVAQHHSAPFKLLLDRHGFKAFDSEDPMFGFFTDNRYEELAHRLKADPALFEDRKISIPFLELELITKDGKVGYVLWNVFYEKPVAYRVYDTPIEGEMTFNLSDPSFFEKTYTGIAQDLYLDLDRHLSAFDFDEAMQRLSAALPTAFVFQPVPAGKETGWRALSQDVESVLFDVHPMGASMDGNILEHQVDLQPKVLKSLGEKTFKLNGFVSVLVFKVHDDEKKIQTGHLPNFCGGEMKCFYDSDKSLVLIAESVESGKKVHFVAIRPRIIFNDTNSSTTTRDLNIDLTPIGLGRYRSLAEQSAYSPVMRLGPYQVYKDVEKSLDEDLDALARLANGLKSAEAFLGFAPGSQIQHIFYVNGDYANAKVSPTNPEAMLVYDEMMVELRKPTGELIGFHEGIHNLDLRLKLSEAPALVGFHQKVMDKKGYPYFYEIDEARFLKLELKTAGHTFQHPAELLASLINSMNHPTWEDKARGMDPYVRAFYYHALVALNQAVSASLLLPQEAPLRKILQSRLAWLEPQVHFTLEECLTHIPS